MIISEATTGGFVDLVPMCRMTERWAENRVETITIEIERKWSQLCREGVCNQVHLSAHQAELVSHD